MRWQAESTPASAAACPQRAAGRRAWTRYRNGYVAPTDWACSSAPRCPRAPNRSPRATRATSSAVGSPASATVARYCSANSSTPRAACATCTSRVQAAHRSPAAVTAWRPSVRCCANTSSAKRCTPLASRPPVRFPSSPPGARCSARRMLDGAVLARVARATCASAASNTSRPQAKSQFCDASPTTPSPGITPPLPTPTTRTSRCSNAVIAAQAKLVARWMLVGFIHGVMNTDNMTISGETIDYGPCAFMDAFDPKTVFSSIDSWGRYAYGNQPTVAGWNLARFAEALLPLIADDQEQGIALATALLEDFPRAVRGRVDGGHAGQTRPADDVDDTVVGGAHRRPAGTPRARPRGLHLVLPSAEPGCPRRCGTGQPTVRRPRSIRRWVARWRALDPDADAMDRVNPVYIPRNHLVEEALAAAAAGDLESAREIARGRHVPLRGTARVRALRRACSRRIRGCYQTFCGT